MSSDNIAGVEFNEKEVSIILNMEQTKSEDMVIKAISHEILHVLEGTNDHRIDFNDKWEKLESVVRNEYEK
jgi:predicted SprT family Zn-dependent metalloprotease